MENINIRPTDVKVWNSIDDKLKALKKSAFRKKSKKNTYHLYFLRIHTRLKARVYTENTSDAWHIPQYPTRKHCITSMYL